MVEEEIIIINSNVTCGLNKQNITKHMFHNMLSLISVLFIMHVETCQKINVEFCLRIYQFLGYVFFFF